jgi:hypothetical protein
MDANTKSYPSAGSPRKKFNFAAFAISFFSFACLATTAQAQEDTVSMKIDLVSWGDAIGGLSLKAPQANGELIAMSFQYSKAVSYSGPKIMEIYKSGNGGLPPAPEMSAEDKSHQLMPLLAETPSPAENKASSPKTGLALELENRRKEKPTLVALAQLPSNCRRATVLLAPSDGGTYIAYVIDDDPSKLPMGQVRIHNLCSFPVAMRINGKNPQELKMRESMLVAVQNEQCMYELAYNVNGEWKMHENNFMMARANQQTQMIVLKSNNQFFKSADGATGGFLQTVTLRRSPEAPAPASPPAATGAP